MTRETIRRRINTIRARSTDKGFTEAEAMAAAEKAAALMREHGLDDDDLVMAEDFAFARISEARHGSRLWAIVATCTNTAAVTSKELDGLRISFVGQEPGPEIAAYLVDICHNAIASELAHFRRGDFYRARRKASTKRKAAIDFKVALIDRLCHRLYDLFGDRIDDGRAARARTERDRRYPSSRTVANRQHKTTYHNAAAAGWSAGGRIALNEGVKSGSGAPRLIGRDC